MKSIMTAPSEINNKNLDQLFETNCRKIGRRLRRSRLMRNQTPEEVAEAIGIKPETLQLLEAGVLNFKMVLLFELCTHYDIEPDIAMN